MRQLLPRLAAIAAAAALATCAAAPVAPPTPSAPRSDLLAELAADAERVRPLVSDSPLAQRFLDQAAALPSRATRHVTVDGVARDLDETYYYAARWGTPVAYARLLQLAEAAGANVSPGARWLDFGFGAPGHLQMLARAGLHAVGVDVDPVGAALYTAPEDTDAPPGTLALAFGRWPADPATTAAVGTGFDVIMSKNVLKRGYIHPAREANPRHLIDLGVDDAAFLGALHRSLAPGGLFILWNLCPSQAPPDAPYIPWADGQSPFSREAWEAAGFEVLAIDVDDTVPARAMAYALHFDASDSPDEPGWDLERDLHAWYTIARKR